MKDKGKDQISTENELLNYQGEDKVITSYELKTQIEKSGQTKEVKVVSGIKSLDTLVDGFVGGELIALSGLTGNGKTLLLKTLTYNFAEQEEIVLWLSYEETPYQFLKSFSSLPFFYIPQRMEPGILWWVEKRILEAKLKYNARIVMIDHIHYIVDLAQMKHPSWEVGIVIRQIKSMAVKYNMIIFLIAHNTKMKRGEKPSIDSIRDSSFIGQEASTVLTIWRVAQHNEARLSIEKARRTGTFKEIIKLVKKDGLLEEIP